MSFKKFIKKAGRSLGKAAKWSIKTGAGLAEAAGVPGASVVNGLLSAKHVVEEPPVSASQAVAMETAAVQGQRVSGDDVKGYLEAAAGGAAAHWAQTTDSGQATTHSAINQMLGKYFPFLVGGAVLLFGGVIWLVTRKPRGRR